jgi:hypothetical protein
MLSDVSTQTSTLEMFYETLEDIGIDYRIDRARIHENAISQVLDLIIKMPEMIGSVYEFDEPPKRDPQARWHFNSIVVMFRDGEPDSTDTKTSVPTNSIRFTWRNHTLVKVETRFEGSWDTYNICEFGRDLREKCERVIELARNNVK